MLIQLIIEIIDKINFKFTFGFIIDDTSFSICALSEENNRLSIEKILSMVLVAIC